LEQTGKISHAFRLSENIAKVLGEGLLCFDSHCRQHNIYYVPY